MDHKNPLKMIDPVTGIEMTMQPPMPANQMGTAKPMFDQTTQNVAQQVYGSLDQRQMSMGAQAPVFMKSPLEGNAFSLELKWLLKKLASLLLKLMEKHLM